MAAIFLARLATPRAEREGAEPLASAELLPGDDVVLRLREATAIAESLEGPFAPLETALHRSATLRAELATRLALPCLARWNAASRIVAALGVVPLVMLAELDRELAQVGAAAGTTSAWLRVALDGAAIVFVVVEIVRRVPSHPRVAALLLLAASARFARFVATTCGNANAAIAAAAVVALGAALVVGLRAPARSQLAREVLAAVDLPPIAPPKLRAPSAALVVSAIAAAAGLPLLLAAMRGAGVASGLQALLFATYGLLPTGIELALDRHAWRASRPSPLIASAIAFGVLLTLALTDAARHLVDAAAYATRCFDPSLFASSARRVLDAQAIEVARPEISERTRMSLLVMNSLIVPLVEERVYRGLLQRVLARRLGANLGLAAAAAIFGLAHLGVYRFAIYQAVLLGVSFGVAYAEGGLVAAAVVHAAWNFYLLS